MKEVSGGKAHIRLKLKLPDANSLSPYLFEWDEDRLNGLPLAERRALIEKLDRWLKEGKIPTIEGKEGKKTAAGIKTMRRKIFTFVLFWLIGLH